MIDIKGDCYKMAFIKRQLLFEDGVQCMNMVDMKGDCYKLTYINGFSPNLVCALILWRSGDLMANFVHSSWSYLRHNLILVSR